MWALVSELTALSSVLELSFPIRGSRAGVPGVFSLE